jgi:hypothetical protein
MRILVDQIFPISYNTCIVNNKELKMETTTMMILVALAYGAFLGYCLGRAQGYYKGAEMVQEIYRK